MMPERDVRLARFWLDELENSLDVMDLEAAREALSNLMGSLLGVSGFLKGSDHA